MKFFTSDTHFGHKNIIRLCDRPFQGIHEMDEELIARWNETVKEHDEVYHLGDFGYKCSVSHLKRIMERLNGRIHLIVGNHDRYTLRANEELDRFTSVFHMLKLWGILDQPITLCHWPMLSWDQSHRGAIQLFGHHHGNKLDKIKKGFQMDVGVDPNNFRPISLDQVIEKLNQEK